MDSLQLPQKPKSSSNLKPKQTLMKDLQKIVKQTITPTSRRHLLKSVLMPQTSKASQSGTTTEKPSKKGKAVKSKTNISMKKSSSKITLKNTSRDLSNRKSRDSETARSKKSAERLINSPKSSLKIIKKSPRRGSAKKLFSIPPGKAKKQNNKLITGICFKTSTGTVNGKPKANNQDDYFVINSYAQNKSQTLVGVMDGHGIFGHEVSAFVKRQLPLMIENNMPYEVTSSSSCSEEILSKIEKAFTQGFLNTQKALINKRIIDINYSGTTAITVMVRENFCICANVGDSRALIGRFNDIWFPVELSSDHKPSIKTEKARIVEAGGRVEPFREAGGNFIGPDRVWLQHEQLPGLAMSRSIGDLVAAHVGVISEPEIVIHELSSFDKFIVVASDGIWEFISSKACVQIVSEFYEKHDISKACDALMAEAVSQWNKQDDVVDDITFIIIFLNENKT